MGALFIFILISVLVFSALLFFNKGEKAQEIKTILKDIYENFKELFSNFKKLFLIVKEVIQSKLDQKPTQLKDESTDSQSEAPTEPEVSTEPEVTTQPEALSEPEVSSEPEVTTQPEALSEPKVTAEPKILPNNELEKTSDDSINDENIDIKTSNF